MFFSFSNLPLFFSILFDSMSINIFHCSFSFDIFYYLMSFSFFSYFSLFDIVIFQFKFFFVLSGSFNCYETPLSIAMSCKAKDIVKYLTDKRARLPPRHWIWYMISLKFELIKMILFSNLKKLSKKIFKNYSAWEDVFLIQHTIPTIVLMG